MKPVVLDRFAGLNLVDNVTEVGLNGAVDVSNVAFDYPGRIRTRPGTAAVISGAGKSFNSLYVMIGGEVLAVDATANLMRAYNGSYAAITTSAHPISTLASYAEFTSAGVVYYTQGQGSQVKKFDGAAITSPASLATIVGDLLAIQPVDNRLVVANLSGLLQFSDPDAPETFTAGNDLTLPSGCNALVAWNGELYALAEDRIHVFYGNSTDSTGGPIFNYRTVDVGVGCYGPRLACAGRDGVYFVGRDGIYRTRGDRPERISDPIGAKWSANGLPMPSFYGGSSAQIESGITAFQTVGDALYFSFGTETFVYELGQWAVYSFGSVSIRPAHATTDVMLFIDTDIKQMSLALTTDSGSAISTRYQSGFYNLETPQDKRIRETLLDGQGTITFALRPDYATSGTGTSVTMGTAPATAQGRSRTAGRGKVLSHRITGTGSWVLDRMTLHIADVRDVR